KRSRFFGQIGVTDPGLGSREVGDLGLRQVDGEVELVLASTDNGLGITQRVDGGGESIDSAFRTALRVDVCGCTGAYGGGGDDRSLATDSGSAFVRTDGHAEAAESAGQAQTFGACRGRFVF